MLPVTVWFCHLHCTCHSAIPHWLPTSFFPHRCHRTACWFVAILPAMPRSGYRATLPAWVLPVLRIHRLRLPFFGSPLYRCLPVRTPCRACTPPRIHVYSHRIAGCAVGFAAPLPLPLPFAYAPRCRCLLPRSGFLRLVLLPLPRFFPVLLVTADVAAPLHRRCGYALNAPFGRATWFFATGWTRATFGSAGSLVLCLSIYLDSLLLYHFGSFSRCCTRFCWFIQHHRRVPYTTLYFIPHAFARMVSPAARRFLYATYAAATCGSPLRLPLYVPLTPYTPSLLNRLRVYWFAHALPAGPRAGSPVTAAVRFCRACVPRRTARMLFAVPFTTMPFCVLVAGFTYTPAAYGCVRSPAHVYHDFAALTVYTLLYLDYAYTAGWVTTPCCAWLCHCLPCRLRLPFPVYQVCCTTFAYAFSRIHRTDTTPLHGSTARFAPPVYTFAHRFTVAQQFYAGALRVRSLRHRCYAILLCSAAPACRTVQDWLLPHGSVPLLPFFCLPVRLRYLLPPVYVTRYLPLYCTCRTVYCRFTTALPLTRHHYRSSPSPYIPLLYTSRYVLLPHVLFVTCRTPLLPRYFHAHLRSAFCRLLRTLLDFAWWIATWVCLQFHGSFGFVWIRVIHCSFTRYLVLRLLDFAPVVRYLVYHLPPTVCFIYTLHHAAAPTGFTTLVRAHLRATGFISLHYCSVAGFFYLCLHAALQHLPQLPLPPYRFAFSRFAFSHAYLSFYACCVLPSRALPTAGSTTFAALLHTAVLRILPASMLPFCRFTTALGCSSHTTFFLRFVHTGFCLRYTTFALLFAFHRCVLLYLVYYLRILPQRIRFCHIPRFTRGCLRVPGLGSLHRYIPQFYV